MELPLPKLPLDALLLAGEQDWRLGLPLELASTEDDLAPGAAGLPREADTGLSGNDVLKFGGVSSENPGISDAFQGLDFTVGDVPRDCTELFDVVAADGFVMEDAAVPDFVTEDVAGADFISEEVREADFGIEDAVGADLVTEEDRPEGADAIGVLDEEADRRVGVDDLDVDLEAGKEGLAVGVKERGADLVGVEDLAVEAAGFTEGKLARDVGVEDLEGLVVVGRVGRPVGVAGLLADFEPPEEDGLLFRVLEEITPADGACCFKARVLFKAGSSGRFASLVFSETGRALDIPIWLIRVFCDSISKEGNSGVPGGVRSQS